MIYREKGDGMKDVGEGQFPELALLRLLTERSRENGAAMETFAAAESCTGGLIAKRFTDLPGASAVFRGGVTVYTNFAKTALLGVPEAALEAGGAVSHGVAALLAQNVRQVLRADYGIGVTGLAGPEGDGIHPVGTVFLGLSTPEATRVWRLSLPPELGREEIRNKAADFAFQLLLYLLRGDFGDFKDAGTAGVAEVAVTL